MNFDGNAKGQEAETEIIIRTQTNDLRQKTKQKGKQLED